MAADAGGGEPRRARVGRFLQPKCGELRMGYCDESSDWEACPIGRVRPHKDALFNLYNQYRKASTPRCGTRTGK